MRPVMRSKCLGGVSFLVCAAALAGPARAYELADLAVESWAGSGPYSAVLVVDFSAAPGDSFAFGYHFADGQITGLTLLNALHAADNGLTVGATGGFVTDFWYDLGDVTYHAGYAWPDVYWSYWLSDDWGGTWDYSGVGAASRVLVDGDADAWFAISGSDTESEPETPLAPAFVTGDVNCDGNVDFFDIDPFVLALTGPGGYAEAYPGCDRMLADCNLDGAVDFFDIDPFVVLLAQ